MGRPKLRRTLGAASLISALLRGAIAQVVLKLGMATYDFVTGSNMPDDCKAAADYSGCAVNLALRAELRL
jgi:hypothetical protein